MAATVAEEAPLVQQTRELTHYPFFAGDEIAEALPAPNDLGNVAHELKFLPLHILRERISRET